MIRPVQKPDYPKLVQLYKSFFKTHNIFQQEEEKIVNYLTESSAKNNLLVAEDANEIKGALFLVNIGASEDESHKRWKFRHFAFANKEIAAELLTEAENIIKEQSKTAKVELTLAETETGIEFYKEHSYEQEGTLKNHYRWGENCFILSKSFF